MLLGLAVVAGCSAHSSSEEEPSHVARTAATEVSEASEPVAEPARRVWRTELEPIGQPVVSGSTALVIVRARGDELDMLGVSVRDGRVRWRHPYSPGATSSGYLLEPEVIKADRGAEFVVFQEAARGLGPASSTVGSTVQVFPRTGDVINRTPPMELYSPWSTCPDGRDACAEGTLPAFPDSGMTVMELDLDDGGVRTGFGGFPPGSRQIGAGGLYATGDRPGERIGRVREGRVLWEVPVEDIFGGGFTTDGGWETHFDERRHLYIGHLGRVISPQERSLYDKGKTVMLDVASHHRMVAFDSRTGRLLWARAGTSDNCLEEIYDGTVAPYPQALCHISALSANKKGSPPTLLNPEAYFEGYEPRTGDSTWTVRLSRRGEGAVLERDVRVVSQHSRAVVVRTDNGVMSLDSRDGSLSPIGRDEVFVCEERDSSIRYPIDGERTGGHLRYICDRDGHRTPHVAATRAAIRDGGVRAANGRFLLATRDGLVCYALR